MPEKGRTMPPVAASQTGRGAGVPERQASQAAGLHVRRTSWLRPLGVSLLYALGAAAATWVAQRLARASERADAGDGYENPGQLPQAQRW